MVSRRILVSVGLSLFALLQIGCCCCHRHHVFRVQNAPCCTPAPKCGCGEQVTAYKGYGGGIEPMPASPMTMPPAIMQQQPR
jgi:hypothetical protein